MLGTRIKVGFAMLSIGASMIVLASAPAGASNGGTGSGAHDRAGYVNPFKPRGWYEGRIDMGVDYVPIHKHAVVAIGNAKILGSDSHSGWPGGHLLWYKLLDGDHAGTVIYVAEELKKLAHKGTRVAAGERIATARPGGSGLRSAGPTAAGSPAPHPATARA